jgi:DNA adenine methylase
VANDLNKELMCFWTVLQNPLLFASFQRHLEATPLSRGEFDRAGVPLNEEDSYESCGGLSVIKAVRFFIRCRQSRAGTFKGFTSLTRSRTRRGINGNASEWLGAVDGLPEVHARLRPVVLEEMDALELIAREDSRVTFSYNDPPYYHPTRTSDDDYAHEFTADQHRRLLDLLAGCQGKWLLSGYRSDLYDAAATKWKWHRTDYEIANHAAGGKSKRRMVECVWSNYIPGSA